MRIPASLRNVDSRRAGGCQKPNCPATGTLHRHHTHHEAMWLGIWASRRRHESKYHELVARYHQFLPEDCVILCPSHHAEIHKIYDAIIQKDRRQLGKSLQKYSWAQAETLMQRLNDTCYEWLKKETPGIDPRVYSRKKANAKSRNMDSRRRRSSTSRKN